MQSLLVVAVLLGGTVGAAAQPADCPVAHYPGASMQIGIDLAGQGGVPPAATGRAYVDVPMQAPDTDCGEPPAPSDVLRGEPGDLLRGPGPDRPSRQ